MLKITKLKLITFSILCFIHFASDASDELPPILNYYPICQYQIADTVTIKKNLSKYEDELKFLPNILKSIRSKAKEIGAEAVIITSRNLKLANTPKNKKPLLSFSAELISQCGNLTANKQRPTPFNKEGQKTLASWDKKITLKGREYKLTQRPILRHPAITDPVVSFDNGVYGVKLGDSYEQVIRSLGDPSIELGILENEPIIGFGRRHWFHFQSNKLVKISTRSEVVSGDHINRIPLRDFFDDLPWKINNKLKHFASLNQVTQVVGRSQKDIKNDKLVINQAHQTLVLNFSSRSHEWKQEKIHRLVDFTLQTQTYQPGLPLIAEKQGKQQKALKQLYTKLNSQDDTELESFFANLGEPMARLYLTANKIISVFNPQLLIETKDNSVDKIYLSESFFAEKTLPAKPQQPWQLGQFKQGQLIDAVREVAPAEAYETEYHIEVEADNYQLVLQFSASSNNKILQGAELIIY